MIRLEGAALVGREFRVGLAFMGFWMVFTMLGISFSRKRKGRCGRRTAELLNVRVVLWFCDEMTESGGLGKVISRFTTRRGVMKCGICEEFWKLLWVVIISRIFFFLVQRANGSFWTFWHFFLNGLETLNRYLDSWKILKVTGGVVFLENFGITCLMYLWFFNEMFD